MKLLAIDGNSIFNRAFYGIRLLSNKEGFYTNAIYGFLTILNKLKEETSPEGIAIAFDMAAPTFRHKMFDGYKSNRKGMPEELAQQLPVLKDLLQALGYKIIECEGWEADDILGTLSYNCEKSGNSCIIATGDRDSLQLVGDNTTVLLATTKASQPQTIKYDKDKIKEDYGTNPQALIDIKALMGDTSDCIPGVAGIGQKTACSLIQKFESLDGVYENIDSPDIKPAMRKKLIDGKDMAYLSRKLGEIAHDAPIDINIDDYKIGEITPDAAKIMTKLELFSIMKRMNLQIFEAAKDTGVTQRYQRADYIDVTGGSDSPKYELLGIGVTQLDDSPSAQTTSKRYVNQKSATQSIGGYEWTAPLEFDLIQSEPAIAYISEIGENEKTGVEADTFYVKVCLDKPVSGSAGTYEAKRRKVAVEISEFKDNDGEIQGSGNLLGKTDWVKGTFNTATKAFTEGE